MKSRTIQVRKTLAIAAVAASVTTARADARPQQAAPSPSEAKSTDPQAALAKVAGKDVPVPTRKKYVAPEYPMSAAVEGIRGIVILELLIDENGTVVSASVTRSIPGLDEAAINAVKLWEYEPTKLGGKPVKVLLSQSITFALKLPDLQRALGIPELKSGGAPSVPSSISSPESASVAVTLGSQGEVRDASLIEGHQALSDSLMRAVKSWRFAVAEGAPTQTFTVRAEWVPGPPPGLVLKALEFKAVAAASTTTSPLPTSAPTPNATAAASPAGGAAVPPTGATPAPTATPEMAPSTASQVATDVLPARQEAPAKEQGISSVSDVVLGQNIPDLVRGRRPVWPPLARLGNATGEVVVRFSVDLAGKVTVHSAEGPDLLKDSAEQAVGTWLFRRTAIDRLNLIATFKYGADRAMANVERQP